MCVLRVACIAGDLGRSKATDRGRAMSYSPVHIDIAADSASAKAQTADSVVRARGPCLTSCAEMTPASEEQQVVESVAAMPTADIASAAREQVTAAAVPAGKAEKDKVAPDCAAMRCFTHQDGLHSRVPRRYGITWHPARVDMSSCLLHKLHQKQLRMLCRPASLA